MIRLAAVIVLTTTVNPSGAKPGPRGLKSLAFLRRQEPYLVEFSGKSAEDEVRKMAPAVRRLEHKLKTRIVRFDIWNDPAAYKLFLLLDKSPNGKSLCGGLPFYYNRKTGRIVCGATTYENLENWATGQSHMLSMPPPMSQEEVEIKGRVTGPKARLARLAKKETRQTGVRSDSVVQEAPQPVPVLRTMPSAAD